MSWKYICKSHDLIENAGVAALVENQQIALFFVPATNEQVFAIGNWDPIGKANVLSRGLIAHLKDDWVVASPLYKEHYSLKTGKCQEADVHVPVWPVKVVDEEVYVKVA